jgi:uncharacterized protein YaiE (UPF0345 family)
LGCRASAKTAANNFNTKHDNMTTQFDNVSVAKKANLYFDGKCVSHTVLFADGTKKTIGVIFPSSLTFNTGAPEIMELNAGKCRIRLKGETEWKTYEGGQRFNVPGNSSFDIETVETLDYVCHFGDA